MNHSVCYDQDFYAWLVYNVQLLRERRFEEADIENITEELEGMSRSEKRQLINRLGILLAHLLKWQFQPDKRSTSWEGTIDEQRRRLNMLLEDSPSLKYEINDKLFRAYEIAIPTAVKETGMKKTTFPKTCPYILQQVLDENFYPND